MSFTSSRSQQQGVAVCREYVFMYACGSVIYTITELLFRGYTHVTMVLTGGVCLMLIHALNAVIHRHSLLLRATLSALLVTAIEFAVGCLVNLYLGLNVWDYSLLPMNFLGQICPRFSFFWLLLCFPAVMISDIVSVGLRPCLRGGLFFGFTMFQRKGSTSYGKTLLQKKKEPRSLE